MKKAMYILGAALLALVSCNKEMTQPADEGTQGIKVNLTINRTDTFAGTKASTVKTDWYDGDVVFVFFHGVKAPKYLEMKRSGGSWTSTDGNGLTAADLGASGKMTAIFLPYASGAKVHNDMSDNFLFVDESYVSINYAGFFLFENGADYTYDGELKGTINLSCYVPSGPMVHYDVSGYTSGHSYEMCQDYLIPLRLDGISYTDGSVSVTEEFKGDPVRGYEDNVTGRISFSGALSAGAPPSAVYEFSVNDATASVLYTKDAGSHTTPIEATSIGLGDLSATTVWTATPYVYLGIDNAGQKLCWATRNLGATADSGEGSYGNYYAWGETTGHALTGTFGSYTCSHDFSTSPTCEVDGYGNLKPEYDAAHAALKGLWRMPTMDEFELLFNNTTHSGFTEDLATSGMTFTSLVTDYTDKSIFLPAAGYVGGTSVLYQGSVGYYWSATKFSDDRGYNLYFYYNGTAYPDNQFYSLTGNPIRPVFGIH